MSQVVHRPVDAETGDADATYVLDELNAATGADADRRFGFGYDATSKLVERARATSFFWLVP